MKLLTEFNGKVMNFLEKGLGAIPDKSGKVIVRRAPTPLTLRTIESKKLQSHWC
jgi:hypothetical protein